MKGAENKPFNNAGKSVLTYKKLVTNMKSPYVNGSIVDNLNKAYFPSKIRRGNKGNSKKKSSTPNVKMRNLQKEYAPSRQQFAYNQSTELDELEKLRILKEQEEYEIMMNQKTNIEQLKKALNDPTNYSIVQEHEKEDEENEEQEYATFNADTPEKVREEYFAQQSVDQNDDELQIEGALQYNNNDINDEDAEVNESEGDNDSEDDNDGEGDDKENEEGKHLDHHQKHEKADDNIPANVIIDNMDPSTKVTKKKSKKGNMPKVIKRLLPNCTDSSTWKKKNKLEKKTRVFKMIGSYPTIRKALHERGWVENKDKASPWFDLLWTLKQRDIDFESLRDGQIVNHFRFNGVITTKVGLCRNIGKVINFNNVDIDTFFPKCFALKDEGEWEDFEEQFKIQKAESILKRFAKSEPIDPDMLDVAMTICRRNLLELDDIIDKPLKCIVKDSEWLLLSKDDKKKNKARESKYSSLGPLKRHNINSSPTSNEKKNNSKRENSYKSPSIVTLKLPGIENKQMYSTLKDSKILIDDQQIKEQATKTVMETVKLKNNEPYKSDSNSKNVNKFVMKNSSPHINLMKDVRVILDRLEKKFPQFKINGDKNIWIAKPAGLSRGRGIQVFSHLEEIEEYTRGKDHNWIVQKYIENPLIVNNRKFDLRIWVLVTDLNPLTIWFWNKPYCRFPAADYNTENLNDRFIHLTNNSVAKYAKEVLTVGDGNMWFIEQLQEYLIKTTGRDIWEEELKQKWKDIVIYSLQSVQDCLDTRRGSMELLGYDIMIDENYNAWLIEVNSSPTMEYSTGVTKVLAQNVMESIVKVISDYTMPTKSKKSKWVDTGDFVMIHKGKKYNEKGLNLFSLNFCWEGRKIY